MKPPKIPQIHSPLDDLDKRIADVGEFIKSQRETAQMSVRRLADLAGVSNPYLSQIERGLRKPSADILQQIAKALQISAETLYVRAGLLSDDADSGHNAVRDAVARATRSSPPSSDMPCSTCTRASSGAMSPSRERAHDHHQRSVGAGVGGKHPPDGEW